MLDPVVFASDLIRVNTVTPDLGGALSLIEKELKRLGFDTHMVLFEEEGTPPVLNLYARIGTASPNICFAGHTDVVSPGDVAGWAKPPFSGDVIDGILHGRGAADMKAAIAAMVAAVERHLAKGPLSGSISFLLTGDEEGPSINGTVKLLEWVKARGETLDYCVVGEPTNPNEFGTMIKVGRRGSLHGVITVAGTQGHVAYPHLADNPIPHLVKLLAALTATPIDEGNAHFQPSNLEVLDLHVGNDADNIIPANARARFNIRFNSNWSPDTLKAEITRRLDSAGVPYTITWRVSGESFLTEPGILTETVQAAVKAVTGKTPELSTTGGTSDARFIKNYCPVVEFGLVGATMHKTDEQVAIADITALTSVYEGILAQLS